MKIGKKALIATSVLTVSLLGFVGCDKPVEEEEEDETTATAVSNTTAAANIGNVSENLLPDSLKQSAGGPSLNLSGGNPCEGTDGFFDCQPNLLKLYLSFGDGMVGMLAEMVPNISEFIATKSVGDTGTQPIEDAEGIESIAYNVVSATAYEATINTTAGAFMYISAGKDADGNDTYELKFDRENDPEWEEGSTGMNKVTTSIVYTSETDFSIDMRLGNGGCDPRDAMGPTYININITRDGETSKGKAMLYMPRWLAGDDADCDADPTATTELFMYTDFAGNDTNATGSLYMAKRAATTLDDFADYAIEDFCTNFPDGCNSDGGFGGDTEHVIATEYQNAFCATTAGAVTWSGACSDIPVTEYSANSLWRLPPDLVNDAAAVAEIELPASFEEE